MEDRARVATAGVDPAVAMVRITKRFPGVVANDDVSVEFARGEVHALLGENGAGKSTLTNVLTGLYRPDAGEIRLRGEPLVLHSPRDAIDAGIAMVHQHFRLVPTFTVAENVVLGELPPRARARVQHGRTVAKRTIERQVHELSERYGLDVDPGARVADLSVGERQRVEILKMLYREADVLVLDEPTAVLTPQEATTLFTTLRAMAGEGRTVVFISHKLGEVLSVADRVTVLRDGRAVGTVDTAHTDARSLAHMMVGRDIVLTRKSDHSVATGAEVVLELRGVCATRGDGRAALVDIDLDVHVGEIVGVAGVAGNGQKELADVAAARLAVTAGSVVAAGHALGRARPRDADAAGVAYVPDDRLGEGLAPDLSVSENLVLHSYRRAPAARPPFLRRSWMRRHAEEVVSSFDVRTPSVDTPVRLLSGGNVQKVLLAREFQDAPKVLVVASPTRGLDVGAIENVRALLVDAAARGAGVLLVSEDLDEVLALSDRIAVMYEGRIAGVVQADGADVTELGLMMAGSRR